jgi:hypothetical protein
LTVARRPRVGPCSTGRARRFGRGGRIRGQTALIVLVSVALYGLVGLVVNLVLSRYVPEQVTS